MTLKGAVVEPIDIGNVAQPPFVRLSDLEKLFERRAGRLQTLSSGHSLTDYLRFIAALVRAQADVVDHAESVPDLDEVAQPHRLFDQQDHAGDEVLGDVLAANKEHMQKRMARRIGEYLLANNLIVFDWSQVDHFGDDSETRLTLRGHLRVLKPGADRVETSDQPNGDYQ